MSTSPALVSADEVRRLGRVELCDVSWDEYVSLRDDAHFDNLSMTYNRGSLSIMSPMFGHEKYKMQLGQMMDIILVERRIPGLAAGQTNFRDRDVLRGIEPDQCYYLTNVDQIRRKHRIELPADPSPDLAIEVDLTTDSADKFDVYAALGIREIWLFDGESLSIHILTSASTYQASDRSLVLPFLPVSELTRFIFLADELECWDWDPAFRAWVAGLDEPA